MSRSYTTSMAISIHIMAISINMSHSCS